MREYEKSFLKKLFFSLIFKYISYLFHLTRCYLIILTKYKRRKRKKICDGNKMNFL